MEDFSGKTVSGMWLPERIWEPGMPSLLRNAGYDYTFLDESHFYAAGIPKEEVWGLFKTEDRGAETIIFPIDKTLRYLIPFHAPEKSFQFLQNMKDKGVSLITYGDDGEKFGSWPGTYEWVYKNKWLEKFLNKLEECDFVSLLLPREAVQKHSSNRNIYLPCASYEEMGEWTLPTKAQVELYRLKRMLQKVKLDKETLPWIRGGFWRQFLAKYPESNRIYRRMLRVSDKINTLRKNVNINILDKAELSLMRGQANDAYWHGIFGGIYLPHLRSAIQRELIIAETIADRNSKPEYHDKYQPYSIILQNDKLRIQIQPELGGGISALDIREAGFNLVDTISRRQEPYHDRMLEASLSKDHKTEEHSSIHERLVVKEQNLEKELAIDHYHRFCFIDRFINDDFDFEDLRYNRDIERGDFTNNIYNVKDINPDSTTLFLEGMINGKSLFLIKKYVFSPDGLSLEVEYELQGDAEDFPDILFAPELNINLLAPDARDRFFLINGDHFKGNNLAGCGKRDDVEKFSLVDEWQGISIDIRASDHALWLWYPVETISLSEAGIERIYQGSAILPAFSLSKICNKKIAVNLHINYWKKII